MPSDHVIVTSTTDSEDAARALVAGVVEIVAIPITGGSAEYLSWLVDETRG